MVKFLHIILRENALCNTIVVHILNSSVGDLRCPFFRLYWGRRGKLVGERV
jgi:hypothetical protein